MKFSCSPHVCVSSVLVLRFSPTVQRHVGDKCTGDSTLTSGVNVSVNQCFFLSVATMVS